MKTRGDLLYLINMSILFQMKFFLEEVKKVVECYSNREEEYPGPTELLKRNKYGIGEFKLFLISA